MIEGMLVYLLLIGIYLVMGFFSTIYRHKVFWIISLVFVIFFVGFKDKISPDLERYALMYENYDTLTYQAIEPFFIFISSVLNKIGFSWVALSFVYALLTILFIVLGIRNSTSNIIFAFLIFLLVPGFFLNLFVEMRQMLAVSFTFYAVSLINMKTKYKKIKIFLLMLLSIITHYSAIGFWLIFLSLKKFLFKKFDFYKYSTILLISAIIPFTGVVNIINKFIVNLLLHFSHISKITSYITYFSTYSTNFYWFLKAGIYTILGLFVSLFYNKFNIRNALFFNLFIIGIVLLNITFFIPEISRIAYYFLIYQIILIPNLVFKCKKEAKILLYYSFFLFYFSLFIKGLFYYSEEAQNYIFLHYKNVVFNKFISEE